MEWHDLSHRIDEDVVRLPFLPAPRFAPLDEPLLAATELTMATHAGTHVEAPRHRFPDGNGIDAYPLDRFVGEGVVWAPAVEAREPVTRDQVESVADRIAPGDALIVHTGWAAHAGTDRYEDHPYLTGDAAAALADCEPSWIGFDAPTPEAPGDVATGETEFPVHTALLGADVLVAENLTNTGALAGERIEVVATPLALADCDASPVRVAARPVARID
ncbi:MAG: cyclase family protein [Haloferacaceae archaeon]